MLCYKVATVLLVTIVSLSEVSADITGAVIIQKGNTYHTTSDGKNVFGTIVSQTNQNVPSFGDDEASSAQSKTIIVTGNPQDDHTYLVSSVKTKNGQTNGYPVNSQQMDHNECDQKIKYLNSQINELKQNILELRGSLNAVAHAVSDLTKQHK